MAKHPKGKKPKLLAVSDDCPSLRQMRLSACDPYIVENSIRDACLDIDDAGVKDLQHFFAYSPKELRQHGRHARLLLRSRKAGRLQGNLQFKMTRQPLRRITEDSAPALRTASANSASKRGQRSANPKNEFKV